ncbi:hypothetical protein RRG08_018469 [Elysia crispata]|uniref:Reverse transcriptase domain-containing protein n=1 Tax=Elysia crispata TaxID=231223 RepID=A0AAE0YV04_9GAST|nr:hypothetical protein RRG08_018469 [Elysia crispata]
MNGLRKFTIPSSLLTHGLSVGSGIPPIAFTFTGIQKGRVCVCKKCETRFKKIQEAIDKGIEEKEISSEIGKALLVPHPTPGRFYILPKVHKEGNPGRPIIGGNGCPTEIISQFVDYHMKDLVSQLLLYVQDDMDFLRKIHDINKTGPLPPDILLCTMDVSALYTNIPHKEGTDACRIALEEGRDPGTKPSPSFIYTLIQLILTLNFFTFHGNTYLQTHGTAMGTCMAPTYANIFMGAIERRVLGSFPDKPLVWLRYIDDIFLIWTHGRAKLEAFIQNANTFHTTIIFTSNISPIHVPFLDVMVTLLDNYIHTDLYSKPTDTFNYLHWSSCYPQHTRRSIPYSLAFRLVRICSSEPALTRRLNDLKHHLKKRGFPPKHTQAAINKALEAPRSKALQRKDRSLSESQRIPLVLTYNPALPNIPSILKKYFPILQTSDRCKKAIPTLPMAAFRRPKNLCDSLMHSSASRRDIVGSGPCNIPRCMTCTSITSSTTFTSTITRKSYNILHNLSCHSHNVIYLITCNLCNKQYVGLTSQTLRKRFNTHRFNINNDRGDAVAKHFNLPGHTISHAKITPIDQLLTADMIGLQNKETFWIHTLQTLEPQGININDQATFPITQIHKHT